MSADITTLLYGSTTQEEKTLAATNIINNYNLNLSKIKILYTFKAARHHDRINCSYSVYLRQEFFFNFLLTSNIRMLEAYVEMCYEDGKHKRAFWPATKFVNINKPFHIGSFGFNTQSGIINTYKLLLDHGDFNIDDLVIPEICKRLIQEYRDEKYGGKLTKAAN